MNYVIFGGDGFLGRYLAEELLKEGKEITICDLNKSDLSIYEKCRFHKVDITDMQQLNNVPMSEDTTVIHLAANQYHLKVPKKGEKIFSLMLIIKGQKIF